MRKIFFLAAFLLLTFRPCFSAEPSETPNPSTKYILFLTADGFRTDYIEWYNPTHLKQLIAEGVRVIHAKNVIPTVTAPNMTSLVTGAYPRTTGIAANSQYVKEEDRIMEKNRGVNAETIAETLRKAGWKTAAVNHFMLDGRGADFYAAPGYDESEATTDGILEMFKSKKARFVAAIYGATDHAGHRHGPHSDDVKEAVLAIDRAVGRLIEGLKELGIYTNTLIAFTADHGMSEFEKREVSVEPAKALRDAGFTVASSNTELNEQTQIVVVNAGMRLIYFRKPLSDEQKTKATKALSTIKGVEVLDRKKLDELDCHNNRSGDLIVSPLPGYTMSHAGKEGGQHGRFAERNPVLFFRGPGFRAGVIVTEANTVDVVPTLLKLVSVAPASSVEGKVITGALSQR